MTSIALLFLSVPVAHAAVEVTIADVEIVEGSVGQRDVVLTFSSPDPVSVTCDVNFSIGAGGTAVAGVDFQPLDGNFDLPAGSTGTDFVVARVNGDVLFEPDETFNVSMFEDADGTPNCPLGADRTALVTIRDDDIANPPKVSVADASITEGDSGEISMRATFSATGPLAFDCDVNFTDVGGSATIDVDWRASPSGANFAAGSLTSPVTIDVITVIGDTDFEGTEAILFRLFNDSDATPNCPIDVGEGATLTINDNDIPSARRVSIGDASSTEGDSGTSNMGFTATLDSPANGTESITVTTTADTATSGSDFVGTTVSLSFTTGQTSAQFAIPIRGDTVDEPNETFTVGITNATNLTVVDGTAIGTILDDDSPPSPPSGPVLISVDHASVTEGNSGKTPMVFKVTLSRASTETVKVKVETNDSQAARSSDFVFFEERLTFLPGETEKLVTVQIRGDKKHERDERFYLVLESPKNAKIDKDHRKGKGIILNDDPDDD